MVDDLFSSHFNLFILCPNGQHDIGTNRSMYVPNPKCTSPIAIQMYEFVGQLLGISLRTHGDFPFAFPSLVWKHVLLSISMEHYKIDMELILDTLTCIHHFTNWSQTRQLLFTSFKCVTQLTQFLSSSCREIIIKVTPLLAIMCSHIPSLPGFYTCHGIQATWEILKQEYTVNCNALTRPIDHVSIQLIQDTCSILRGTLKTTSMDRIQTVFQPVDVIGYIFDIIMLVASTPRCKHEICKKLDDPLQVLVQLSDMSWTHERFLLLLIPLSTLLSSWHETQDSTLPSIAMEHDAMHYLILILFNIICRTQDKQLLDRALKMGEMTVLVQLLSLERWISFLSLPTTSTLNTETVRFVLKLVHTYVNNNEYKHICKSWYFDLMSLTFLGSYRYNRTCSSSNSVYRCNHGT